MISESEVLLPSQCTYPYLLPTSSHKYYFKCRISAYIPINFEASNLYGKLQERCVCKRVLWKSGIHQQFIIQKKIIKVKIEQVKIWKVHLAYLVHVKFDIDKGHSLVCIAIMLQHPIHGLWDIFHNQIEKELIFACCGEETMLQTNYIWMIHHTHQLKFPVLISSVLQNLLYSHSLTSFQAFGLREKIISIVYDK